MKLLNNVFLALIVIASVVLAGCGNQDVLTSSKTYVGGTDGLVMEFQEGQPPQEIYDSDSMPFSVGVILKNMGEHAIFDETYGTNDDFEDFGRITLRGINPEHFGLEANELIFDFENEGVSLMPYKLIDGTTLEGGMATPLFGPLQYKYELQGTNDLKFGIDLCYNYKTKSTTTICVLSDFTSRNYKVCNPYEAKSTSNSGGPIHITSVKQAPGGNKVTIMIEIEKVNSDGNVFKAVESSSATNGLVCEDNPANQDKNKVKMKVYLPEEEKVITCSEFSDDNEGIIMLHDGQPKIIVCSMAVDEDEPDYETQLFIDLEYSFGQYMDKTIQLKSYN